MNETQMSLVGYSPTEMKLVRIYSFRLKTKSYGCDTGDFN